MEGCPFTGTCMVGTRVGLLVDMPAARDNTSDKKHAQVH